MQYKVISKEQKEETINTKVEYIFDSGEVVELDIPHFMVSSVADVMQGIENRWLSEQRKLEATKLNAQIIEEIKVDEVLTIKE